MAHLLGYFQLHSQGRVVRLESLTHCSVIAKNADDGEHKVYWRLVKEDAQFSADPWFRKNIADKDQCDVDHRNAGNYHDHVGKYPSGTALNEDLVRERIGRISKIPVVDPPIPVVSKFPDVEAVQIVAYQRIVKVRRLVDECLGSSNRFWKVHRQPSWLGTLVDFQVAEPEGLAAAGTP